MNITGEYTIPGDRQEVWDALNDAEVLKACIPGCEEMERVSDTEFLARITAKIGSIRAKLKGVIELSNIDPPNSYTISGSGQGGVAGFVKGGAQVKLSDAGAGGTLLAYEVQVDLGGKLAAVGSRVIQGVAKKMADDFFGKFARVVSGEVEEGAAEPEQASAAEPVAGVPRGGAAGRGIPNWLKCAIANAIVSSIAVAVAVAMVND